MRKISQDKIKEAQLVLTRQKVFTFDQLLGILGCSVRSGRSKIKQWQALTSYNQNGRYYTMPSVPRFDSHGLWQYKGIYFSKHGTLKNTVVNLVNESGAGLAASHIGQMLGLSPRSFLHHFKATPGIFREKHGGVYIYFSDDEAKYESQRRKRVESIALSSAPLSEAEAILILVSLIQHHGITLDQIMELSQIKKSRLSRAVVSDFMLRHDLVKKTAGTRP